MNKSRKQVRVHAVAGAEDIGSPSELARLTAVLETLTEAFTGPLAAFATPVTKAAAEDLLAALIGAEGKPNEGLWPNLTQLLEAIRAFFTPPAQPAVFPAATISANSLLPNFRLPASFSVLTRPGAGEFALVPIRTDPVPTRQEIDRQLGALLGQIGTEQAAAEATRNALNEDFIEPGKIFQELVERVRQAASGLRRQTGNIREQTQRYFDANPNAPGQAVVPNHFAAAERLLQYAHAHPDAPLPPESTSKGGNNQ
jgi:hypothetical protein